MTNSNGPARPVRTQPAEGEPQKAPVPEAQPPATEFDGMSREVRLGLVLYGGVSLAVYMNGVAQEFFNAVRGRGIYALIKALTDSDIIVDIVSGASAGGINGIFLAYALCNEKEFGDFAPLWREQGDVSLLLRQPDGTPGTFTSLFDSEGYYQNRLQDAFRAVRDIDQSVVETPSGVFDGVFPDGGNKKSERPHVKELDLFISGTNVGGNIFTQIDDAGHAITVKDHRTVFILRHRLGRKLPFSLETRDSLAKLARITSAFPAAFSPVEVEDAKEDGRTPSSVDGWLQRWGRMGVKAYLVDGGVLYNKPFGYTIRDIIDRLANTEVERLLLYVEPDPERFENVLKEQQEGLAKAPSFFEGISDSLVSLPDYQSIASDLQELAEQNSKVKRYQLLTRKIHEQLWEDPEKMDRPAVGLYLRSRLLGLGQTVIEGALRQGEPGDNLIRAVPLNPVEAQAAEKLAAGLLELVEGENNKSAVLEDIDVHYRLRRTFHAVLLIRDILYKDRTVDLQSDQARNYLKLRYVLNRQIEFLQIVRTVMEELVDLYQIIDWTKIESPHQIDVKGTWELVENLLKNLLNVEGSLPVLDHQGARAKYEDCLEDYCRSWEPGWREKSLLALEGEWLPQATLSTVIDGLRSIRDELRKCEPNAVPQPERFRSVLSAVDGCTERAFAALTEPGDRVRTAYANFEAVDSVLYPIELAGELQCRDVIKTVRLSPCDAQRGFSRKKPNEKVAGIGFYHFAAFFKQSWRSNDIMWGRLDGICQLAESLLKKDRLCRIIPTRDEERLELKKIRNRFGLTNTENGSSISGNHPLHPDRLFPNNSPGSRKALLDWLERLLSNSQDERKKALDELPPGGANGAGGSTIGGPLELLIEMAQYEVIHELLPQVAHDAAQEQLEWNSYSTRGSGGRNAAARAQGPLRFDPNAGAFREGSGELDPTSVAIATAVAAERGIGDIEGRQPLPGNTPRETPLGQFFVNYFGLKSTNLLQNLPPAVLSLTVLRAARVLLRCALTALGSTGKPIESSAAFRWVIDRPLRLLYGYALWWHKSPGDERYRRIAIWAVCVALLLVGIAARDSVLFPDGHFSFVWLGVLIVAPAGVLALMCLAGQLFGMRWRWMLLIPLFLALSILSYSALPEICLRVVHLTPGSAPVRLPTWHAILWLAVVGVLGFAIGVALNFRKSQGEKP